VKVLLVTGTDTGVGKTVTTAALASLVDGSGSRVCVVKPVQTGVAAGEAGDVDEVVRLAGSVATRELVRLPDPLAPAAAARAAGVPIPDVAGHARSVLALAAAYDVVLVEGAGGLLVPFDSSGGTVADLAVQLRDAGVAVRCVVVARAGLGTLNHSALTTEALRHRRLDCAGVVLGSWPVEPDAAMLANLLDLPAVTRRPLLASIPAGAGSLPASLFRAEAPAWFRANPEAWW